MGTVFFYPLRRGKPAGVGLWFEGNDVGAMRLMMYRLTPK